MDGLTLDGRTAIVTGAGNGLGRAEAIALARAGARLVLGDLNGPAVHAVADEIVAAGGQAVAREGDIGDWSTGESLLAAALDTFGTLDVLLNNPGLLPARLLGALGQPNYAAAKAGIAALTVVTARSCARYGVRVNVICPRARTGMTADLMGGPARGRGGPAGPGPCGAAGGVPGQPGGRGDQ